MIEKYEAQIERLEDVFDNEDFMIIPIDEREDIKKIGHNSFKRIKAQIDGAKAKDENIFEKNEDGEYRIQDRYDNLIAAALGNLTNSAASITTGGSRKYIRKKKRKTKRKKSYWFF